MADLDHAGIAKGLLDQNLGQRRGLAAGREVDSLDECVGTLASERLDESGHGAAHHRRRAGDVVAVPAAEAGARDQEGAGWVRPPRRGRASRPRAASRRARSPSRQASGSSSASGRLRVEGRQPVDAVYRPLRPSRPRSDGRRLVVVLSAVRYQHLDAELLEPRHAARWQHRRRRASRSLGCRPRARRPSARSAPAPVARRAPECGAGTRQAPHPPEAQRQRARLRGLLARRPAPPGRSSTNPTTWLRVG